MTESKNKGRVTLTPARYEDGSIVPGVFLDVAGGLEPAYQRSVDQGEVQFWHETGYGYLPASRVRIVNTGSL